VAVHAQVSLGASDAAGYRWRSDDDLPPRGTPRCPPRGGWPDDTLVAPARSALEALGVARFCKDQPELVDALLRDVLLSLTRRADTLCGEVAARLQELEALERRRLHDAEAARSQAERRPAHPVTLDAATLDALRAKSRAEVAARPREPDATLTNAWGPQVRAWSDVAAVFGDLGQLMGRGWDLTAGVLRHTGWRDLTALRALMERLPQLREVVRALGRLRASDAGAPVSEVVFGPVRRLEEELRAVRTPHLPHDVRGIERSGEVARMLPAEAAMLGHPKLRLLWHARRIERALVTYRVEGVAHERVTVERDAAQSKTVTRPRPERGPILAVVDTSGSMHGLPEQVAKAIVLEALRTAHTERRRCVLYLFSGPGQVIEHELSVSAEGVGRLLAFPGLSFGGGSDETAVLARVTSRLKENHWERADVVFVSDGEWPPPGEALLAEVTRTKNQGTRYHGVQIGNRGRTGLHAICDPVHEFWDWAAVAG